ncbi:hypothetical protein Q5H93_02880 [Hymenobacter sp. ASUV-10]|uniref:Uncharacterized protein n=1 Tax=Hymenobacter aranciens TaxID=3063996 RepID=A0ABT9B648_9BACT|nr:hypothetical protein [Hymenobacter sp. ASUV-10]MDO7873663.1 hypothetical protein [Hymenobacter sp. ASUV-10]
MGIFALAILISGVASWAHIKYETSIRRDQKSRDIAEFAILLSKRLPQRDAAMADDIISRIREAHPDAENLDTDDLADYDQQTMLGDDGEYHGGRIIEQ